MGFKFRFVKIPPSSKKIDYFRLYLPNKGPRYQFSKKKKIDHL